MGAPLPSGRVGNVDATHSDVGFVNGPVLTMDDAPPRAKACALKNRRLVAIG